MSENDEDFVCNIMANTLRYVTDFPSAVYLADVTNINDIYVDFTTAVF